MYFKTNLGINIWYTHLVIWKIVLFKLLTKVWLLDERGNAILLRPGVCVDTDSLDCFWSFSSFTAGSVFCFNVCSLAKGIISELGGRCHTVFCEAVL